MATTYFFFSVVWINYENTIFCPFIYFTKYSLVSISLFIFESLVWWQITTNRPTDIQIISAIFSNLFQLRQTSICLKSKIYLILSHNLMILPLIFTNFPNLNHCIGCVPRAHQDLCEQAHPAPQNLLRGPHRGEVHHRPRDRARDRVC